MNQYFLDQYNKLQQQAQNPQYRDLQGLFVHNQQRVEQLSFSVADILVDFSKNWINPEILSELLKLAYFAHLEDKIKALFAGEKINVSEQQAATHTLLRQTNSTQNIMVARQKMLQVAKKYQSGQWLSAFAKKITTVVNIGIGGSYLGPKLAVEALTELQTNNPIKVLFYATIDSVELQSIIQSCDLTSTLFCICSKSFGTIETAQNTAAVMALLQAMPDYNPTATNQSFVAATAHGQKAQALQIPPSHIMPFDATTGGRFSVWSSIGFSVLMAIGEEKFLQFLAGAESIDRHFENTPLSRNVPVLMALLSVWYRNFLHLPAYAIIPYDQRLKSLPAWLQQLMMESNGKMVDIDGKSLPHSAAPWVFGEHGQLAQHAFFQAFHQGKDILPIDFIGVKQANNANQEFLLINMLAQSAALMAGDKEADVYAHCSGNRPSSTFIINQLNATTLGQLLAVYEHMVFVQSVIWNINCFDQPGVELGKKIAREIVAHWQDGNLETMHLDASTQKLLLKVLTNEQ